MSTQQVWTKEDQAAWQQSLKPAVLHQDFKKAEKKPESLTEKPWSESPYVRNIQKKWETKPVLVRVLTPEELEEERRESEERNRQYVEEERQKEDRGRRNVSAAMMGYASCYAGIRLLDNSIKETAAVRFFRDELAANSDTRNYMLVGPPGSGKTFATIAFIAEVSPDKYYCRYIRAYEIAEAVHRKDFETQSQLKKVQVLLIDDLGAEPDGFMGSDFAAFLDCLVDIRHQHGRTTLYTANATWDKIRERYGERFVSRFRSSGKVLSVTDPDLRRP